MNPFAKIEQFFSGLIERAFAKTFPSDLEPAQIARKLMATMQARTREENGRLRAPAAYAVYVSPADFERLLEHQEYLERAWAELLRNLAAKVGVDFEAKAAVTMAPRESVPLGAVEIEAESRTASAPAFALRTVEGLPPRGLYRIDGTSRIGRSEESEIVLLDPSVSRSHAVVEISQGMAIVRDLGSTNGTFVNGRRVESENLRHGDELRFGNTRMRFEARR